MKACGTPGRVGEWECGEGESWDGVERGHAFTRSERGTLMGGGRREGDGEGGEEARREGRAGGVQRRKREKIQDSHLAAKTKGAHTLSSSHPPILTTRRLSCCPENGCRDGELRTDRMSPRAADSCQRCW